ncbi:MAG: FtsW/RodA/SpoVE family cell cycle protein [Deltaproteobacteria bacterium]|nr:FtsW/RodA/SpoVE family cell cycle protein [Deltaproteobacteria bacterium]
MNRHPAFPWIARIANLIVEPADYERVILPALADAWHERPDHHAAGWRARVALHILRTALVAAWARTVQSALRTRWWAFGLATLAGVAGCIGLRTSMQGGSGAHAQLIFLAIGLVVGLLIALMPDRWLQGAGTVATILGAMALLVVVSHGTAFDGARRWLCMGSICIHVSTLVLPVFGAVMVRAARSRFRLAAPAVTLAVLGLLALEPDAAAVVIYGMVALVAARRSRALLPVAAISSLGSMVALSGHVVLTPVPHVEGAAELLALEHPLWFVVAMASIAGLCLVALSAWVRAATRHRGGESSIGAATTALVALLFVPWVMGDGGVPWVSYGGSAIVAAFMLIAWLLRAERRGREDSGHLDRA